MPDRPPSPRQVLVFSGHRVDAADRPQPRFPLARVPAAGAEIARVLAGWQAGPQDLALTQGAAGGDLLFADACLALGVPVQLLLPMDEDRFVADSVRPSPGPWEARYRALRARLARPPRVLDRDGGPGPEDGEAAAPGGDPAAAGVDSAAADGDLAVAGSDRYERCNRWLLDEARAAGGRLRLLVLWDGLAGDGPGGTADMMRRAGERGAEVRWIDTRRLA